MGLIESEKLITDIQGIASEVCMKSPYDPEWFTRLHNRQKEIIRIVEMQPKVDAEPVKHGRWIKRDIVPDYMWKYCCSCCHSDGERRYNYCPNCGAKMDEVK